MNRRGGRLLAISVDPPEKSREVVKKRSLGFHILADVDRKLISAFGLVHSGMGPGGSDVAMPAQLLFDKGGRIAWRRASRRVQDRAPHDEILAAIHTLDKGGPRPANP